MKVKELRKKLKELDDDKEVYSTSYDYEKVSQIETREICVGWDKENQEKIYKEVPVVV